MAETKPPLTSPTVIQNVALLIQRRTRRGRWATVGLGLTRARTATFSGFSRRLRLRRGGRYRALVRTTGGDYVDGGSRSVPVSLRRHRRG